MSLDVPKPIEIRLEDETPKEIKLPQALEKALDYKTERGPNRLALIPRK